MCQFLSAIATRKGEILVNPLTDHHHELIAHFNLHERKAGGTAQNFIKLEFVPGRSAENDAPIYDDPKGYTLRVDEDETPAWFDDEAKAAADKFLRGVIKRMIVRDKRAILLGGCWIIAEGAEVAAAKECRIAALCGGTLTEMRGGTLTEMWGGTLTEMWGGTLTAMRGGTLTEMRGGTLTAMCGGTLTEMWGGTLTAMCGGTLMEMRGGTLTEMWGGTLERTGPNANLPDQVKKSRESKLAMAK
jgi:hypothetical protein